MKELSIEQKAKAYDEAKYIMKEYLESGNAGVIAENTIKKAFPELKESEDEKIKKGLISYFGDFHLQTFADLDPKRILAWLEKQGKQKPVMSYDALREGITHFGITQYQIDNWLKKYIDVEKYAKQKFADKEEPKFKIGDWLQYRSHKPFLVEAITEQGYCSGDECLPFSWEDEIHIWTIKDAKPGDILEFGDHGRLVIGITSYINYQNGKVDVICLLENDKFKAGNYYALDTIKPHPATKERCDLLFEKMKDTGYKWNPSTLNLEYILKES